MCGPRDCCSPPDILPMASDVQYAHCQATAALVDHAPYPCRVSITAGIKRIDAMVKREREECKGK